MYACVILLVAVNSDVCNLLKCCCSEWFNWIGVLSFHLCKIHRSMCGSENTSSWYPLENSDCVILYAIRKYSAPTATQHDISWSRQRVRNMVSIGNWNDISPCASHNTFWMLIVFWYSISIPTLRVYNFNNIEKHHCSARLFTCHHNDNNAYRNELASACEHVCHQMKFAIIKTLLFGSLFHL